MEAHKYPRWSIDRAKSRVANIPRETLLKKKPKNKGVTNNKLTPITFSTTYSPFFKQVVSIKKHRLPILTSYDTTANLLDGGIRFVPRKAPTIDNIHSPSLFQENTIQDSNWLCVKGFYKCGHKICTACNHTRNSNTFTSIVTHKTYDIKTS